MAEQRAIRISSIRRTKHRAVSVKKSRLPHFCIFLQETSFKRYIRSRCLHTALCCQITTRGPAPHPVAMVMNDAGSGAPGNSAVSGSWAPIGEKCRVSTSVQLWRISHSKEQPVQDVQKHLTVVTNFSALYLSSRLVFSMPPPSNSYFT